MMKPREKRNDLATSLMKDVRKNDTNLKKRLYIDDQVRIKQKFMIIDRIYCSLCRIVTVLL